jgi:hypothetical protein
MKVWKDDESTKKLKACGMGDEGHLDSDIVGKKSIKLAQVHSSKCIRVRKDRVKMVAMHDLNI